MKIFYLAYLSLFDGESRFCSPAANNVCSYITDVLLRNTDDEIVVINLSQHKKHLKFGRSKVTNVQKNVFVNAPCYGSGRLLSRISCFFLNRWVKKYLKRNSSPHDRIIVYHSLNTLKLEAFISQNFNSILQVEEIYCDIFSKSSKIANKEIYTINMFSKHIFVSDSLKNDSRIKSFNNLVFYGSLSLPVNVSCSHKDEKSIVYAGTLEKSLGIEFACNLMELLPDYKLYIYGHGTKSALNELMIKYRKSENIIFCDPLKEDDLIKKLSLYKYGISPRDPSTNYSTTSFPSKILTYLKSGLIVVSSEFNSVLNSPFRECLIFSKYDLESFRDSIVFSSHNSERFKLLKAQNVIKKLDENFYVSLINLLYEK